MRAGSVSITLATLILLTLWGCGGSESPYGRGVSTVPVKGKVTYKGQPLIKGSVTFEPDGGREAHGSIQPDGTFVLTTFKEGDGAITGVHRIAVSGTGNGGKEVVPVKYRNTSSSKVQVEVTEGKTDYTIDLN